MDQKKIIMTRREARFEAQRLVVNEGYTYAETSAAVGIPVSTLQKWGASERWMENREISVPYASQVRAAKAGLLKTMVELGKSDTVRPQDISRLADAWMKLERGLVDPSMTADQPRIARRRVAS